MVAELVDVVVDVHLMLSVRMKHLSGLLDLLLTRPVVCHVVESTALSTRATGNHWIPFATASVS